MTHSHLVFSSSEMKEGVPILELCSDGQPVWPDLQDFPGHGQQRQALDEVRVGVFPVLVLEVPQEHVHVQVLQLGHLLSIANSHL